MTEVVAAQVARNPVRRLPFSFANRYKIVLEWHDGLEAPTVYYVAPMSMAPLAEVRRVVKGSLTLVELPA